MFDFPAGPTPGQIYTYGDVGYQFNGYGWNRLGQELVEPPGGIADGDKGDIVVSGSGYIWQFDPTVVTAAGRALLDDANAAAQRTTLGLGNVDNTSDASKPISSATQAALNNKYDKTGGPISGGVSINHAAGLTVNGPESVAGDLSVTSGRLFLYGLSGNTAVSVMYLNGAVDKYLYQDGVNLQLVGVPLRVNSTAASSNASTGALVVGGGVGIGGNLNVAASETVAGNLTVSGLITAAAGTIWNYGFGGNSDRGVFYLNSSGSRYIDQNAGLLNFVGDKINVADTTDATSSAAGSAALTVQGGVGVAKAILSGGLIQAGTTLKSTGITYFGSSGLHWAGPVDVNTEYHMFGPSHAWIYNKANGNIVWYNSGGETFYLYEAGHAWIRGNLTIGGGFAAGNAGISTTGGLSVTGAGSFGSLSVTGGGSFGGALSVASLSSGGNIGGTRIDGTAIYSSGVLQSGGALYLYNDTSFGFIQGGGYRYQHYGTNWYWRCLQGGGALEWIGDRGIGQQVFFNFRNDAAFLMSFDLAYKPGGGVWGDSSDSRIKTVIANYVGGLDQILQLQPVRYKFKGNDTPDPPGPHPTGPDEDPKPTPRAAPFPNSPHYGVAMEQTQFIGLIAQEVEGVMPEMVTSHAGYIDGAPIADIRDLNTGPLIFALINAVKTLSARVAALEAAR